MVAKEEISSIVVVFVVVVVVVVTWRRTQLQWQVLVPQQKS